MGGADEAWCELGFDGVAAEAARYTSPRQRARVLTEGWMALNGFCPACAAEPLPRLPANRPGADFTCESCGEVYELKAGRKPPGARVPDGAYETMRRRVLAADNPNLFVMAYDLAASRVTDLIVVPRHFFTPEIIAPKKPTLPKGRASPWVGCDILLGRVPATGRIPLIEGGRRRPRAEVLARWRETLFLAQASLRARGWLLAVMGVVEDVTSTDPGRTFSLAEVYAHEARLSALYPGNRHVREKVRQQLQRLRDQGWLEFVGPGLYRRVPG